MAKLKIDDPYRVGLNNLITAINAEVPLDMLDQVLILLQLDEAEKVMRFNEWIKAHLGEDGHLHDVTAKKIMNATAKISKEHYPV